jgi:BlaI family transcriptional regulator, penicillinase repressor
LGIHLADREAEIMAVLWERGPSTVTEVRELLGDHLAYTTVQTILRNLEGKGYVGHEQEGRQHRFRTLVARDAARRNAVQQLASKLFRGSSAVLLTHMVADVDLTAEELLQIRKALNARIKKSAT